MPRTSRASRGGFVYHLLSRRNGRRDDFRKADDFAAFVNLMREAHQKVPMRMTGFCLMTNRPEAVTSVLYQAAEAFSDIDERSASEANFLRDVLELTR